MIIEVLIEQLTALYTDPKQPRASSLEMLGKINLILLDTSMEIDQRCNTLEMYLINSIASATNQTHKNTLLVTLKIVLLNRGYYTDNAGQLEKTLLLKPLDMTQKEPLIVKLGKEFFIEISCKISQCLDSHKRGHNH